MQLRLYHYWRSSSSWRVRWALTHKKIPFELIAVNLLSDEPEQAPHLARHPMGYVPVLEVSSPPSEPWFLGESMAILEWIEETFPTPSLLPNSTQLRAQVRQLAETINAGTQPLQNPNVVETHSTDPLEQKHWNQTWIKKGLTAYEALIQKSAGQFSVGDTLTLADLFLIPQCYNALRFEVPLEQFPKIQKIYLHCRTLESCERSSPEHFKPSS